MRESCSAKVRVRLAPAGCPTLLRISSCHSDPSCPPFQLFYLGVFSHPELLVYHQSRLDVEAIYSRWIYQLLHSCQTVHCAWVSRVPAGFKSRKAPSPSPLALVERASWWRAVGFQPARSTHKDLLVGIMSQQRLDELNHLASTSRWPSWLLQGWTSGKSRRVPVGHLRPGL